MDWCGAGSSRASSSPSGFGIATALYVRGVPGLGTGPRLAGVVALAYAFSLQDPEYRWLTLFLLVFLVGLLTRNRAGLAALAVAGLMAGFCLLLKFSLGFSAAVDAALGCALVRRPQVVAARLAVAAVTVAIGLLSGWLGAGRRSRRRRDATLMTGLADRRSDTLRR